MFYNDDEMRLKDLKHENKGIFYYVNEIKPLPFNELIEIETIDLGFQMIHGNRIISPFVKNIYKDNAEETLIELAKIIVSMFSNKWEKTFNVIENDLQLETYNLETTESVDETGNRSSTREDISENERLNLITTFDSEDYSNDDKEINTGNLNVTDTGSTEHNKQVTRTVKGNTSNRLSDVNRYINILQKNLINDIIYTDVSKLIGLSIY